jgi:hypothetical protein
MASVGSFRVGAFLEAMIDAASYSARLEDPDNSNELRGIAMRLAGSLSFA